MFQFADLNAPYAPRLLEHPRFKADTDAIPKSDQDRLTSLIRDINNRTSITQDHAQGVGYHLYFCDGSSKDGRAGAGVYHVRGLSHIYRDFEVQAQREDSWYSSRERLLQIGGGRKATSFDAEMLALVLTSKHIRDMATHLPRKETNIFSDSVAALKLITDPSPHPGQSLSLIFIRNILATLDENPDLLITIDWFPGHSNVHGNERADRLANEARPMKGVHKHAAVTHLKTKTARRIMKKWQRDLGTKRSRSSGSLDFAYTYPLSSSPSNLFKETTRELFGRLSQTLTGHGYTREYYQKLRIPDTSPWCMCSTTVGAPVFHSRRHVLSQCPRHEKFRLLLKEVTL